MQQKHQIRPIQPNSAAGSLLPILVDPLLIRRLKQLVNRLPGVNSNDVWDETDDGRASLSGFAHEDLYSDEERAWDDADDDGCASLSGFLHDAISVYDNVVDPYSNEEAGGNTDFARQTTLHRGLRKDWTVKGIRMRKALILHETITIYEACRRMAARRVDALLLTNSNQLLCGILTGKDIVARVVAEDIDFKSTSVSKVMTKNPVFVQSDTLAAEALKKMVKGKFKHLPVVENGEVIGLLDIADIAANLNFRMSGA